MGRENPLQLICKNCGSPIGFDIIKQTYRCQYCGELSGIDEINKEVVNWRKLQKMNLESRVDNYDIEEYSCPGCGAQILFKPGEASETCDFCGTKLIRKDLLDKDHMPEMIIPFFITEKEAKDRFMTWAKENSNTPEGKAVLSNMDKLKGYYLPYYLVKGPVEGDVSRDDIQRLYHCKGYLEGTIVNTTRQLDNIILNEVEPFDWSKVKPFEFGYIAGSKVKLCDLSDKDIEKRVLYEVEQDFLPEVEKVLQSQGVTINLEAGELMSMPILLPIYFIKTGNLTAAMNGQTGRVVAFKERYKESIPWIIEPTIYTILATVLTAIPYHFMPQALFLFGSVYGLIIFSVMGIGGESIIKRVMIRSQNAKATREDGSLVIEEKDDILKNPYNNTPIFYEKNKNGIEVPVKIKFYSLFRAFSIFLKMFIAIFLPAIIAGIIRYMTLKTGENFFDKFYIGYGAAWYCIGVFLAGLYYLMSARRDVYNHPILYEIKDNGKLKLMGSHKSRKLSFFAMFGVGEIDEDGKRVSLFTMLRLMGGLGVFLVVALLVMLIGSVAAILS